MLVRVVCNRSRLAVVRSLATSRSTISPIALGGGAPDIEGREQKKQKQHRRLRSPVVEPASWIALLLAFPDTPRQTSVNFVLQFRANFANIVHGVLAAVGFHHAERGLESPSFWRNATVSSSSG